MFHTRFLCCCACSTLLGIEISSYLVETRSNQTTIGYNICFSESYIIHAHCMDALILSNFLIGLSIFLYVLSGIKF